MSQTKAQLLDGKSATIQFTGGSASAPSVSFTGDTNTGIYSPGADQVAISTGGSGRLFVDASGNVIAGTASPVNVRRLHIVDSNQVVASIESTGTTAARISFKDANTTDNAQNSIGAIGQNLVFWSGNTERMRLDSSGRLGVGTSSPGFPIESKLTGVDSTIWGYNVAQFADATANNTGLRIGTNTSTSGLTQLIAATNSAASQFGFWTYNGSAWGERMRLDSSGRLGIGTTSPGSIATGYGVVHVSGANGGGVVLGASGYVAGSASGVEFGTTTNNPVAFFSNNAERARIDSSGRLLVGTSSGSYKFQINALGSGGFAFDDVSGTISNTFGTGGGLALRAQVASSSGGGEVYLGGSTRGDSNINSIVLSTANTERLRIGANGYIHASNTGSYYSTGTFHELSGNSATDASLLVGSFNTSKNHGNTSACLVVADYDSDYTDSNLFGGWNVTNNSWRILIRGNGNVENVNNSYGALSDAKLKENIVNAGSQWDDIKALQVRKYNFKEGQTHIQIGLIAQEVELVSPGLVSESPDRDEDGNDLGTVTKSVNYSVLYMKAVKALQEAMERIETLEAKVAALESA